MITVHRNPLGIEAQYLAGLNACFHDWGGAEMFRWSFERAFDGQLPDLLVVKDQDRIVAGSAVSYRRARVGARAPFRVGIMTGAWTLPEARHRGYFTRLVRESRAIAAERGAALLLAFVTSTTASYRRLAAAGAAQWDSYYLVSTPNTRPENSTVSIQSIADRLRGVAAILEPHGPCAGGARFIYKHDEWLSQFLKRPTETEFLSIGNDELAVIEKRENSDRLLFFSSADDAGFGFALRALSGRSAARGRTFMLFTTSRSWRNISVETGFNCLPGYLMALPADEEARRASLPDDAWPDLQWELQSGDRM